MKSTIKKTLLLAVIPVLAYNLPAQAAGGINPGIARANLELSQGNKKQAVQLLQEAVRQNPADLSTRRLLVETFLEMGQTVRAASEMQLLVASGLRSPEDFCLLGDAYRYSGKHSNAIRNYQEALNISPDFARAKAGMALSYMLAGCPGIAEQVCKEALLSSKTASSRNEYSQALKTIKEAREQRRAMNTSESLAL